MTDLDPHLGKQIKPEFEKSDLNDFSKLNIIDSSLHLRIYDQQGNLQPFIMADTPMNRRYACWIQIHDRY